MSAWHRIQQQVEQTGHQFFSLLDDSASVQERLLNDILTTNADSEIGRQRDFATTTSIKEFQQRNPVTRYEDLHKTMDQVQSGVENVLTQEPVVLFEETGGSSGGSKLIPITASGLEGVQNAVIPWLHNLLTHRPGIINGSAYWSISPATRSPRLIGGIPVGLSSDAAYFGPELGQDIVETLAVPPEISVISNFDDWRCQTLSYLLSRKDLAFISVWSPTFLLDLVKSIPEHLDRIIHNSSVSDTSVVLSKSRIEEIQEAIQGSRIDTQALWPKLDSISCWLDASSARYKDELERLFPSIYLQGKGLLATEGVVSIPVCGEEGSVLAINSGFFEFVDEQEQIFLSHELVLDKTYRVLLTTYSGLYRYDLGDQVTVSGFLGTTPLINFCGRTGLVSDLCGEKLTEAFVLKQISELSGTALLAPTDNPKPGYVIFLEATDFDVHSAKTITEAVEQGLCANPQYAYAIQIGQLNRLSYCRVDQLWNRYIDYQRSCGRSIGDIKPAVLSVDSALFKVLSQARSIA